MHRFLWSGLAFLPLVLRAGLGNLCGIGWGRGLALMVLGGPVMSIISYTGFLFVPLGHDGFGKLQAGLEVVDDDLGDCHQRQRQSPDTKDDAEQDMECRQRGHARKAESDHGNELVLGFCWTPDTCDRLSISGLFDDEGH